MPNSIRSTLGNIPPEKLTAMELQWLYKHLLENGRVVYTESRSKPKGLSVKTVRNINQMISSALNCAVEQRMIPANPTKGCVLPKLERKEMKILPPESLGTFFEGHGAAVCSSCTTSTSQLASGGENCWG